MVKKEIRSASKLLKTRGQGGGKGAPPVNERKREKKNANGGRIMKKGGKSLKSAIDPTQRVKKKETHNGI